MEEPGDAVLSRLLSATGGEDVFHRRYRLACEGASSSVRRSLGNRRDGPEKVESFINVVLAANFRHLVAERPGILYWHVDPEERGVVIAHDIDSTWVYMFPYDDDRRHRDDFYDAPLR